ncbi:MAG TPA: hypothetical protein VIN38_10295 [Thiobacillus sp.]
MGMSLLDLIRRKKPKHIREAYVDTPTLFGGMGAEPHAEEKKISVLSAAGGKTAKRSKKRRSSRSQAPFIRTPYLIVLVGVVSFAGAWQVGLFEGGQATALVSDLKSAWNRNVAFLSQEPRTRLVQEHVTPVIEAASTSSEVDSFMLGATQSAESAVIERMEPPVSSGFSVSEGSSAEGISAALNRPASGSGPDAPAAPVPQSVKPAPVRAPVVAKAKPRVSTPKAINIAGQNDSGTSQKIAATEKVTSTKVQLAKSREPDADAQLMEALLVHLRKSEATRNK